MSEAYWKGKRRLEQNWTPVGGGRPNLFTPRDFAILSYNLLGEEGGIQRLKKLIAMESSEGDESVERTLGIARRNIHLRTNSHQKNMELYEQWKDKAPVFYEEPCELEPAFSDEGWVSMGTFPGADQPVSSAATDASGNLFIGGSSVTTITDVVVNGVAKWDGSKWSTLGSGLNRQAYAFAASGNDVYVGGEFTTAGGKVSVNLAKFQGIVDDPPGAVSTDQE